MKTAMQELIEELSFIESLKYEIDLSKKSILKTVAIQVAFEKEKQQIIDAYQDGHYIKDEFFNPFDYYNQTYNTKQHIIDIMKADEEDGLYNQNK